MKNVDKFFEYARKRQQIYIDRQAGKPQPWTNDKILQKYRFCNVFRELDKTTKWFADNVRDPMSEKRDPRILLANVVFRMFNRIETGEAIFRDDDLLGGHSVFDEFSEKGDIRPLKRAILKRLGKRGPYVTGSYIISAPPGYSKLDGVLEVVRRFYKQKREWSGVLDMMGWEGEQGATELLTENPGKFTLESTWEWLRQFDYLGTFHSYEIVTDLRHTYLLDRAPDIMTWANPGPGCRRGLNRVMGREKNAKFYSQDEILISMAKILGKSKKREYWPQSRIDTNKMWMYDHEWPRWEMRDVEHTLCEFDKYERTRAGEGRPRGVFK
jgi:hypothetical protein